VSILTRDDVQHLARLARLELAAEEIDLFARQLAGILEFARQVDAVDTTSAAPLEPTTHPSDPLREDVVLPSLDREAVLADAPGADSAAGLFKVPRVLNG
jgi:aspartyl-tRNA(Asn)/glutamyl-tRNA(Gln) amidotransferase subunit C